MKSVKVWITYEHIKNGKKGPTTCPVSLALRENGYPNARVGQELAFLEDADDMWHLNRLTMNFIKLFDARQMVHPIEVELRNEFSRYERS